MEAHFCFFFFLSLQCKNVRKKPSSKQIFVISTLRKNLHSQKSFLLVCFNRYVVTHGPLADCTFAFIYLDECLLLADGTYILVCSPMSWWVMYYGVAFRSVLMIHSSIWEKTYLFLYWENIYFGQITLKNRVFRWVAFLAECRAEVSLSLHSCAVNRTKCFESVCSHICADWACFSSTERDSLLCWKEGVFGHVIQFWRKPWAEMLHP